MGSDEKKNKEYSVKDQIVRYSFYFAFVFLATTATITFIEAIRTDDPLVRHIMNLETCISIIAGYFYSIFIDKINHESSIDWSEFTLLRYSDWSITTPFMLLSLVLFLSSNTKIPVTIYIILIIWILNYLMLLFGFLGEVGYLDRQTSCLAGFVPFLLMLWLIYINYIEPQYNFANTILFFLYVIIWSMYGIVYLLEQEWKNFVMNILDLTAKGIVGIGMWMYFIQVIH